MDPAAAAIAMEKMNKMTPQQRAQMMDSMRNVDPSMIQAAMSQMKSMKADDWARAREQMGQMDLEQMTQQTAQMGAQINAQQQYAYDASVQLKNEGNKLHGAGRYSEAAEKYERARTNLATHSGKEAADMRRACSTNLASCYLNLKQHQQCIDVCSDVLATDVDNLKALYRRGQANLGLRRWFAAEADLRRAVQLSAHDAAQLVLIREKLQEAKDMVHVERQAGRVADDGAAAASAAAAPQPLITEVKEPAVPSAGARPEVPPGMSADMIKQAADMLRQNPDMVKQAQSMMSGMSPGQLRTMAQQAGLGDVDVDTLRAGPAGLQELTPEMLEMMTAMPREVLVATGTNQQASATTGPVELGRTGWEGAAASSHGPDAAQLAQAQAMMQSNPEMLKMAAQMLGSMPPEQLEQLSTHSGMKLTPELAKAAASFASTMTPTDMQRMAQMAGPSRSNASDGAIRAVPPQVGVATAAAGVPPDMAEMASEVMSNMSAEDLARMQRMAASMGMDGGASAGSFPPGAPGSFSPEALAQMQEQMMSSPGMMDSMMSMMQSMDPEALASMMVSTGMVGSKEQAAAMASQLKRLSPGQMKMMAKAANVVQQSVRTYQRSKSFIRDNVWLVAALVLLLLAVLLRLFNVL